mmetsp:Transcript_70660/g.133305  ORF Transcript_70660/g.133305 Transcript_70660/m.133305 type:complete len:1250 (-) Transcript_70660:108-3857(-)
MQKAFGAQLDDSDSDGDDSDSDSHSSSSSSSDSEDSSVRKKVSFGKFHKSQKFRESASLKAVNGDVEDTPNKGKSTVWSRLRDTVLGATQHSRKDKPPDKGNVSSSPASGPEKASILTQMGESKTKGSILTQVGTEESPGMSGNEWVAKLQSTELIRHRHKQSCQAIASIFEDIMPDQVWSLSTADRIKFNGRISSEVQNAMQQFGLTCFELIENSKNELDTAKKLKNELETKLLEMQRTYLKEISTNRDRTRDPNGTIQAAVDAMDQNLLIEFYEPLQYLSDDMRAAVISIVDEKVKQLFKCNPDLQQFANNVEMNKFESMMLTDKVESLERMNASLREESREIRSKLKKVEHKLAKAEWELSEAKRTHQKTERELFRYQAAQAAEVTKAMTCATEEPDHKGSVGSRRPTRFSVVRSEEVPVVPPICGQRRSTRFALDGKGAKKRCSFAAMEAKAEPNASGDAADSQETKACSSCGQSYLPEALFCSRCGHKLGDCPPAAPSAPKQANMGRRGSRFVAAFDDGLNLMGDDEAAHQPVLSIAASNAQANAASSSAASGIRNFASVVANVMKTATGGSKASSKRLGRSKTGVESDASSAQPPSPKLGRSVVPQEAVFSDEEEQSPTKTTRTAAKRRVRKSHTVGQESSFRKTESLKSLTSWSSSASQVSLASAACKSPPPALEPAAPSADPEPPPLPQEPPSPKEPGEAPEQLESPELQEAPDPQEPEVTGDDNERRYSSSNIRITVLEHDLEKARSDLVKTRNQLRVSMEELSECRDQLATAESRIEKIEERSDFSGDLTDCPSCQRLEGVLEARKVKLEETNALLSKELELTQCLRERLEQAGFVLASADIGRLEVIAALEETPLPRDFAANYKSQLLSDRSLAEELDKIKALLGEDSALSQSDTSLPQRQLIRDVSPASSKTEALPEVKPEGRKRSKDRVAGKPADSYRKESQEENRLNLEIEKLVERNKLFQDKVNIKSAQLASVCKENQVLKLALEDMQREVNTLTSDLRSAMPSQEVAPANLESVLDRMEKVVQDGKVPVHMRLHQEAKLRDVAVTTKRTKIADMADDERTEPPRRVFSPESTCSVQSFASTATPGRGSSVTPMSTPLSASNMALATLEPLSSPRSTSKARKGSGEMGSNEKITRTDKKRSTMSRHTISLGGPALDAAEEMAMQKAASIKSNPASSPRNASSFAARRSETLMNVNGDKSLPPVSGTGEQKGNLLLGKGGMALLGSSAKKLSPVR